MNIFKKLESNLKEKFEDNGFVYSHAGYFNINTIKNKLSIYNSSLKKTNIKKGSVQYQTLNRIKDEFQGFYDFCDEYNLDPRDFVKTDRSSKYSKYFITNKTLHTNTVDLLDYGLRALYLILEQESISVLEIFNVRINGSKITYSYIGKDYLLPTLHKILGVDRLDTTSSAVNGDREYNQRFVSYYNLYKQYYPETKLIQSKDEDYVIIVGNLTDNVVRDFEYFNNLNKLPCEKCLFLVDNAFIDYGIQNNRHGGCV